MRDFSSRAIARLFALLALAATAVAAVQAQERVLVDRRSPYNRILVIENERGLRTLEFGDGNARQTVVDPRDPDHLEARYARAVPFAFALAPRASRMLVVGLGGGAIPSYLHRRLPALAIDAVEIDPVVVEVARSHFNFRDDALLRAHVADGRRFMEEARARYDVVLLDAYGGDTVPHALTTREFLESVRRVLAPRGVVVSNLWSREQNRLYDAMLRTYREVFDEVYVLEVEDAVNRLVVACPWKAGLSRDEAVRRARELKASLGLRHDLGEIVSRGFRPAGRDGEGAPVLRDAEPVPAR